MIFPHERAFDLFWFKSRSSKEKDWFIEAYEIFSVTVGFKVISW